LFCFVVARVLYINTVRLGNYEMCCRTLCTYIASKCTYNKHKNKLYFVCTIFL